MIEFELSNIIFFNQKIKRKVSIFEIVIIVLLNL
jgi:hypothetical protein